MPGARVTLMGDLERAVMDRLWQHQAISGQDAALTVRDIHDLLQPDRASAYTTVMTVLDRLYDKGIVERVRVGRAWHYRPCYSLERLTARHMVQMLRDAGAVGRYGTLSEFVRELDHDERSVARRALEEAAGPRRLGRHG